MTSIEWADAARGYTAVLSILLIVLFMRLAIQRAVRYGIKPGTNPHPLTSIGLSLVFFAIVYRRQVTTGEPGDWLLWLSVASCTLTMLGMALAITWRLPPFLRARKHSGETNDDYDRRHDERHPRT